MTILSLHSTMQQIYKVQAFVVVQIQDKHEKKYHDVMEF